MFQQVPIALINGAIAVLKRPSLFIPALQVKVELACIARYYTAESLWPWDKACQRSDVDASPSYEQVSRIVFRAGGAGRNGWTVPA